MNAGSRIILINTATGKKFSYTHEQDVVYVDEESIDLKSRDQKKVLWLLLNSLNKCVTYEHVHQARGLSNDVDPAPSSHKFMTQFRAYLSHHKAMKGFITTLRTQGYIVNTDWQPAIASAQVIQANEFIATLEHIVQSCIEHSENCDLVTRPNGIQYLKFDNNLALQKFSLLDKLLWDLVAMLSQSVPYAQLIDLKDEFHELSTYILFWRLGDSLSVAKWKSDYAVEIQTKANNIRRQLESLSLK